MLDRITGSGQAMLLALLNETNQTNFTLDDVEFDAPESINDPGFNTRVFVRAGRTDSFYDEKYVRFNRLNLAEFFTLYQSRYVVTAGTYTTQQVADLLNDTYGSSIDFRDFAPNEVTVDLASLNMFELTAAEDSLLFTGSTFLTLENTEQPPEEDDMHYMALIASLTVNVDTHGPGGQASVDGANITFTDGSYVTEFIAFSSDPTDVSSYSVDDLTQLEFVSGEVFHAVHNEYSAQHALRLTQYLVGNSDGGFRRHFNGPRTKVADLAVDTQSPTNMSFTVTNAVAHEREGGDNAYSVVLKFNHPDLDAPIFVCSTYFHYYSNW